MADAELNLPEGEVADGLFNVRSQGSNPGYESVQRVTLGSGCNRQNIARPLPAIFRPVVGLVSFIIKGGARRNAR